MQRERGVGNGTGLGGRERKQVVYQIKIDKMTSGHVLSAYHSKSSERQSRWKVFAGVVAIPGVVAGVAAWILHFGARRTGSRRSVPARAVQSKLQLQERTQVASSCVGNNAMSNVRAIDKLTARRLLP